MGRRRPELGDPLIPAYVVPAQDAGTRPAGTTGYEVHAGFSLLAIDVPALPVFPVLTLGAAVERALSDRIDVGARYTTWLGFDHRLGPELQLGLVPSGDWTVGVRTHPWARIAGSGQGSLSYGGDLSDQSALVVTRRAGETALTVEAGATVQLVLFERLDGESFVDTKPWLATVDGAVELAWTDRWAKALALRLEIGVPRAPDDPLAVLGVRPRLVVAGHFGTERKAPPAAPKP